MTPASALVGRLRKEDMRPRCSQSDWCQQHLEYCSCIRYAEAADALEAQAAEIARFGNALGDAARELPQVAGTVAHRIQVYRAEWQERIEQAERELAELKREAERWSNNERKL